MGDLFVYILKSSLCLAVFYLFFKLMLSRETFHKFNRIVLFTLFVFSLIIPFIEITLQKETPYSGMTLNLEALLAMAQPAEAGPVVAPQSDSWLIALLAIYMTGVAVTAAIALFSFVRMYALLATRESQRIILGKNIILVIHKKGIAPFSWMRYIAISEKDYEENGKEIITHELAHISKLHSIDLLVAEIVKIVQWFNPAAWLLKQELQNIHEYQADEAVIEKGIDAKQYQLLLIKKAVGDRLYTIANSFNHSKLKNRITMITKKKSTRVAALKALIVVPLSVLAVVAFASEKVSTALKPVSEVKITDFIQKDTIKKEVRTFVIIKDTNKIVKHGVKHGAKHDSMTFTIVTNETSLVQEDKEGKKTGAKTVFVSTHINVNHDSTKTIRWEAKNSPLIIVNGKEIDREIEMAIDRTHIKDRTIIKGDKAIELYGEKAKNGVIIINLTNPGEMNHSFSYSWNLKDKKNVVYVVDGVEKEDFKSESGGTNKISSVKIIKGNDLDRTDGEKGERSFIMINSKNSSGKGGITVRGVGTLSEKDKPLYIIDGVVSEDSTYNNSIAPEAIESITVLKGDVAIQKYGQKAKNGVVSITLKNGKPTEKGQGVVIKGIKPGETPLYVVDGVIKKNFDMKSINPEKITAIAVLKGDQAIKKYGKKAKNGVIEITLKGK